LNYVSFLTYQGYFIGEPELFDIEDLDDVIGLKAIRLVVNFERVVTETDTKISIKNHEPMLD